MKIKALGHIALGSACLCAGADAQTVRRALSTARVSEPLRNIRIFYATGRWLEEPKIIGGLRARPGADPWQVALLDAGPMDGPRRPFCGGSLVTSEWVVTAAHCVDSGTRPQDLDVLGGTADVSTGGTRSRVKQIIVHPEWKPKPLRWNDVALVRLVTPINVQATPIKILPSTSEARAIPAGQPVRVTGWGAVSNGGDMVKDLRAVEVKIVSFAYCNDEVSYPGRIHQSMICAGFGVGGKDSCQGDSGGPLTVLFNGQRYLAGIVSWGDKCGQPNKYGVYSRAAMFERWVAQCTAAGAQCA